jgi:hypothetical protein
MRTWLGGALILSAAAWSAWPKGETASDELVGAK